MFPFTPKVGFRIDSLTCTENLGENIKEGKLTFQKMDVRQLDMSKRLILLNSNFNPFFSLKGFSSVS